MARPKGSWMLWGGRGPLVRLGAVAVVGAAAAAALAAHPTASAAPQARQDQTLARIIGGDPAAAGAWPAAVALGRVGIEPFRGTFCGGTVVHPQWVATAAHCVQNTPPQQLVVHTGSNRLRSRQIQTVAVKRIVRAQWRPTVDRNDLALLQLSEPVASDAMQLARPDDFRVGRWATILGWGSVRESGHGKSRVLRQGRLRLVDGGECRRLWRNINTQRQMCAGLTSHSRVVDSCYGDSGGPLILLDSAGSPRLAGIASYGTPLCGAPRSPGVYTLVAPFARWISRTIARFTPAPPTAPASPPTAVRAPDPTAPHTLDPAVAGAGPGRLLPRPEAP